MAFAKGSIICIDISQSKTDAVCVIWQKKYNFTYDKKSKNILEYNDELFVQMLSAGYKFMYILPTKERYLVKIKEW